VKEFKKKYVLDNNIREINPTYVSILQEIISNVIIRNTRKQVSSYINFTDRIPHTNILSPSNAEKTLYLSITEKLRKLYSTQFSPMIIMGYQKYISSSTASTKSALYTMKKTKLISTEEFDELMSLANKITIDSKMTHLLNIVKTSNSKFLIFCEFLATQDYISEILEQRGYSTVLFNGKMSSEEKVESIDLFRNGTQILISTGAGGEGQNFQFCHNVINYDLPWNPMKIEQRIGRVHRIGQKQDVNINNYALEGTIEAYILELLFSKIELFTMTLGDLDVMFEGVSSEEISKKYFHDYMTSKK